MKTYWYTVFSQFKLSCFVARAVLGEILTSARANLSALCVVLCSFYFTDRYYILQDPVSPLALYRAPVFLRIRKSCDLCDRIYSVRGSPCEFIRARDPGSSWPLRIRTRQKIFITTKRRRKTPRGLECAESLIFPNPRNFVHD